MLYSDQFLTIYFGNASDKLYQDYYLGLRRIPLESQQFSTLKQLPLQDVVFLKQIHGDQGTVVHDTIDSFVTPGDYLITQKKIGLGVMTADCLPIIIYDRAHHAVAAVHAGWRGSVQEIAAKAITHMQQEFGTQCKDLTVYFGPSAHGCCYQVQKNFNQELEKFSYGGQAVSTRNGALYFDLPMFNRLQLESLGINSNAINQDYARCTMCDPRYFSHRRQASKAGRQMTVVCLR